MMMIMTDAKGCGRGKILNIKPAILGKECSLHRHDLMLAPPKFLSGAPLLSLTRFNIPHSDSMAKIAIIQNHTIFRNKQNNEATYSFSSSLKSSKLLFFFSRSRFFPGRSGFRSPSSRAYSCARSAVESLSANSVSRDCGL